MRLCKGAAAVRQGQLPMGCISSVTKAPAQDPTGQYVPVVQLPRFLRACIPDTRTKASNGAERCKSGMITFGPSPIMVSFSKTSPFQTMMGSPSAQTGRSQSPHRTSTVPEVLCPPPPGAQIGRSQPPHRTSTVPEVLCPPPFGAQTGRGQPPHLEETSYWSGFSGDGHDIVERLSKHLQNTSKSSSSKASSSVRATPFSDTGIRMYSSRSGPKKHQQSLNLSGAGPSRQSSRPSASLAPICGSSASTSFADTERCYISFVDTEDTLPGSNHTLLSHASVGSVARRMGPVLRYPGAARPTPEIAFEEVLNPPTVVNDSSFARRSISLTPRCASEPPRFLRRSHVYERG